MDKFLDYNGDVILFHMNNICKSNEIDSFLNDYEFKIWTKCEQLLINSCLLTTNTHQ